MLFGVKSEKVIFSGKEINNNAVQEKETGKKTRGAKKGHIGKGRKIPADLPIVEEILQENKCPKCGKERMQLDGLESVSWQVCMKKQYYLKKFIRITYGPTCDCDRRKILMAPPPVQLIPTGEYKDGELFLRINREMRPFILGLKKNFTQYHIENIKPLKSGYSIRIFEMLKMNAWKSETYRIKLDELKKMFGIEDKYKLYTDFKKDVIERAKTELKEHCEIYFEYLEIKHGNKVAEIEFTILRQRKEFSTKEIPVAPMDFIDVEPISAPDSKDGGSYQGELFDMASQPQYSELGQKLIKMGFMGDPETFIQEEGRELVEITLKAIEATSGVNNPIGLLRERVKAIKLQTVLLMQEHEAKRKREEADLKFAREKELVAETRVQEARKREMEDDAKYSGYLADFYDYCKESPSNDFIKADFINDFKQKYELREITRFSEIGGIVQGCFYKWFERQNNLTVFP
ncbi:MAG TPA: hypothetical protein DD381_14340 [Lentisphaeria bacterium]|nr:MAG: hypothetical protein A2X47_00930 [Lentisphaerae bacterium GWF2_38_69]HBM17504.1 hypothetical protein [Lentisphaeria bacterium]